MDNCIYQERKLINYSIEKYFNQLKGSKLLSEEERKASNGILQKLEKTCTIRSVSRVFKPSELSLGNGVLLLGEEKIHARLFEQNNFHDIMSVLVFIITIAASDVNSNNDHLTEQKSDLLEQYYESAWKYAALQGHRDHIIEEYKFKGKQSGEESFTPILGPGYFDIDLDNSFKIYKLLNGKKIGITLNDKMQFVPANTICGLVIGMNAISSISENCKFMFNNPCQYCLSIKKACGYCSYNHN